MARYRNKLVYDATGEIRDDETICQYWKISDLHEVEKVVEEHK